MKKFLVIGNPIDHSLSPKIHNYWIKKFNLKAEYSKKNLKKEEISDIINEIRKENINGINITVPFKKTVLPFLDELTPLAKSAQSVNTIFKKDGKIFGDNTDVSGFEQAIEHIKYKIKNKKILILGAGGVVPSIILALKRLGVSNIFISNRTIEKAYEIKKTHKELEIIEWNKMVDFDVIINATSLGLKKNDIISLDFDGLKKGKLFYDVIYNPIKTNFLLKGEELGNQIENGKMMFIYQARLAFKIWHNILPEVDDELLNL